MHNRSCCGRYIVWWEERITGDGWCRLLLGASLLLRLGLSDNKLRRLWNICHSLGESILLLKTLIAVFSAILLFHVKLCFFNRLVVQNVNKLWCDFEKLYVAA